MQGQLLTPDDTGEVGEPTEASGWPGVKKKIKSFSATERVAITTDDRQKRKEEKKAKDDEKRRMKEEVFFNTQNILTNHNKNLSTLEGYSCKELIIKKSV